LAERGENESMQVTAIIAAAGEGRRVGAAVPKQLLEIGGRTILERSVEAFASHPEIQDVIVVLPRGLETAPGASAAPHVRIVAGGPRRQDSVANAFDAVRAEADIIVIHDAARPFVTAEIISRAIRAAAEHGAAIVARGAQDTVKRVVGTGSAARVAETLPRESIVLAQTPQAFRRDVLARAVALGRAGAEATDEAALAEAAGDPVHVVEGSPDNVKITTAEDLAWARARAADARPALSRVGTGYDLHRLVEGRPLILGGIEVPAERGALGHSDADVVCHSATDAILGAASLGDIGRHFPDSDPAWKGASSVELLRTAVALVRQSGFRIVNLDVVVILERPKIGPFLARIRERLGEVLGIDAARVSVKGKTNEGLDAVGRGEAIAAHAVALLTEG
jgi:2-C-methyl-D-erythritol 4-phosphate cytidylyltransferase/2-C-methyl-D-erythritol 2,4-cyclodiphosphate synthase